MSSKFEPLARGRELDPPFYIVTPALRQRLDLLHHLLEFGRQLILVQGDEGSGRSRMLDAVVEEAGTHWRALQHDGAEIATPQRLVAALTAGLGLARSDGGRIPPISRLREDLAARRADGQVVVLVVDDASALDAGCCTLLHELALGNEDAGELHVLLAADAAGEFAQRLEALAPESALLHIVDVPPLDLDAVYQLYTHVARDLDPDSVASDEDVAALAQACGGNPLQLIRAFRAAGDSEAAPPADHPVAVPRKPGKYLAIAALCLAGAVAGALIHRAGTRHQPEPAVIEMTLPGPGVARRPIGVAMPSPKAGTDAVTPGPHPGANAESGVALVARAGGSDDADAEPSAYAVVAADTGNEAGAPAPGVALPPAPEGAEIPVAPTALPGAAPESSASPGTPATPTSPPVPAIDGPRVATDGAATVPSSPAMVKLAPHKEAAVKPLDAATAPRPARASLAYDSEWVLKQSAQSYVVQLFGSHDQEAARRFIAAHGLAGRATVVRITHAGAPWHIVIYGHYPTRAEANRAVSALPTALAALKPWPRLVGSLTP